MAYDHARQIVGIGTVQSKMFDVIIRELIKVRYFLR